MFDADRPILKSDQDRLNRGQFARYLARCMLDHKDTDSFVVGLYGGWGAGKTSLINLVVEELNLAGSSLLEDEKPIILNFSPWSYSGQNQLIYNFFRRLSGVIRSAEHLENADRIIYLLELYVSYFTDKPAPKIVQKKKKFWQFSKRQKQLDEERAWESGRDPISVKNELNELLTKQKHKIVIIIDNISRLQNQEIKSMFQIVKSMAAYANTAYLLAFDKAHVIHAINKIDDGGGNEFIEKVVQLPFTIPPITMQDIEIIFIDRLKSIVETVPEDTWNTEYWADIYYGALKYLFTNCRDVSRYINTLKFSYPRVREVVNPVDFFALTAIEIFMPEVYGGIRDNKDLFTDLLDNVYKMNDDERAKDKARCDEIIAREKNIAHEIVLTLLIQLFPRLRKIYFPEITSYHSEDIARKSRRACSPDLFEIYFRLSMHSGSIASAEFETLLAQSSDREQFDHALARLNQDGRIEMFLDQLDGKPLRDLAKDNLSAIIHSLIDNGDLFPSGHTGLLSIDTPMRIHRIIHAILKRIENQEERFNLLRDAIKESTKSLYIMVREIKEQNREHSDNEDTFLPLAYRDLTPEQLSSLKILVVERIKSWAEHNQLADHPRLLPILFAWMEWGSEDACQSYVAQLTASDRGLISFLSAALNRPIEQAMTKYEKNPAWDKYLDDISSLIDPYSLEEHAKTLFEDGYFDKLREREQLAIMIFLDLVKSSSVKIIPNTTIT